MNASKLEDAIRLIQSAINISRTMSESDSALRIQKSWVDAAIFHLKDGVFCLNESEKYLLRNNQSVPAYKSLRERYPDRKLFEITQLIHQFQETL